MRMMQMLRQYPDQNFDLTKEMRLKKVSPEPIVSNGLVSNAGQLNILLFLINIDKIYPL